MALIGISKRARVRLLGEMTFLIGNGTDYVAQKSVRSRRPFTEKYSGTECPGLFRALLDDMGACMTAEGDPAGGPCARRESLDSASEAEVEAARLRRLEWRERMRAEEREVEAQRANAPKMEVIVRWGESSRGIAVRGWENIQTTVMQRLGLVASEVFTPRGLLPATASMELDACALCRAGCWRTYGMGASSTARRRCSRCRGRPQRLYELYL